MSGFVAGGAPQAFTLSNDGFWPDVDADALRAALRIDASVTNARLEVAAVAAVLSVNRELKAPKLAWQAEGHATLAAVPADQVNGQSELLALYRRAVYCTTAAEVAERYRSFDATNSGEAKADELAPSADEYRRDARFAIRDLLGVSRTTVELI
ncbi:head completion/stabilization protein [Pseudomonas lalucatii]|uniref:Head completion/stabilization protein n=1 Tax=Pseudomonas lalucatii TaxID=1424203 RepID=A0ABS5PXH6_9PSED|nr:head completion/stabilization protein [Pseudomonas lalucatii]MBS7660569.1 head completion/stabilization protein [Pseudomonas lalucatii]MBS7724578.1 head completion/stabilization protein [Pseudomonas lalucatii]